MGLCFWGEEGADFPDEVFLVATHNSLRRHSRTICCHPMSEKQQLNRGGRHSLCVCCPLHEVAPKMRRHPLYIGSQFENGHTRWG